MNKIKMLLLVCFLLVLTLFFLPLVMNNQSLIDINTVAGTVSQVILGQALLVTFVLGCLVGFVVGFITISSYYLKMRRMKKQLKRIQVESEVINAREN